MQKSSLRNIDVFCVTSEGNMVGNAEDIKLAAIELFKRAFATGTAGKTGKLFMLRMVAPVAFRVCKMDPVVFTVVIAAAKAT